MEPEKSKQVVNILLTKKSSYKADVIKFSNHSSTNAGEKEMQFFQQAHTISCPYFTEYLHTST